MPVRIVWTSRALGTIARHGTSTHEAQRALTGTFDHRKVGDRRPVIGRAAGRVVFVVLQASDAFPEAEEVVTARVATRAEKRLLERRGKGS